MAAGQRTVLVLFAADVFVRNVVSSGALRAILDDPGLVVRIVASDRTVHDLGPLHALPGWSGTVADPPARERPWSRLEQLHRVARRHRSRSLAIQTRLLPRKRLAILKCLARPGVRRLVQALVLAAAGRNRALERKIAELGPDLVLAPSGGNEALVNDAIRAARRLGIPSLVVMHNWDGLSTKGSLPVRPDHVAVWGEQTRRHAMDVVGFDDSEVHVVGSPTLDLYLREREDAASPFPFEYLVVAGCYAPFDERGLLERLDDIVDRSGHDLKIVYRPHPHRAPRAKPDRIVEGALRHVVLDPAVAASYHASFLQARSQRWTPTFYPDLYGYAGLLGHARMVVCPLSTMMLEASLVGKEVLVVAYDDGVNEQAPHVRVAFDHFEGIQDIPTFHVVRRGEDLEAKLLPLLAWPRPAADPSLLRHWVHYDERPYSRRLCDLTHGLTYACP